MIVLENCHIAVIGLGYVGLPLAVAFSRHHPVVGFDVDAQRIAELRSGLDRTGEVPEADLGRTRGWTLSNDPADLRACNVYIVTVPTPVDEANRPDLRALITATETVGSVLGKGDVVIYESTVFPGTTEEICVPVLERCSGLRLNEGFYCGYSPERINPGDREHRLENVCKVTSGSCPKAAEFVDALYRQIVHAGTHRAPSIRVAEAAKVIENIQRDVNIALINELAMMFQVMGIDTQDVLDAARTKWNFLPFRPGLVGGHCIGVDPWYLTHKATILGYHPELILSARRINSRMGIHVANQLIRLLAGQGLPVAGARALVLGFAFKENCPDVRNTRVAEMVRELQALRIRVDVVDPLVDPERAQREYGIRVTAEPPPDARYHAVVLAVAHDRLVEWAPTLYAERTVPGAVLYDIKSVLPREMVTARL